MMRFNRAAGNAAGVQIGRAHDHHARDFESARESGNVSRSAKISDEQIDAWWEICRRGRMFAHNCGNACQRQKVIVEIPPEKFDPAVDQYLSTKIAASGDRGTESIPCGARDACNLWWALPAATREVAGRGAAAPLEALCTNLSVLVMSSVVEDISNFRKEVARGPRCASLRSE